MQVTSKAIVLNSMKYGDTSKINRVFSRDYGLISIIAKGARKPKSKYGSALDVMSICSITFYHKENKDLFLLSGAELDKPLGKIRNSFEHLITGMMLLESILLTQRKNLDNPQLYDFLEETLVYLNTIPENPFSAFVYFQLKLARNMGFGLNLNTTQKSGSNILFSLQEGSIVETGTGGEKIIELLPHTLEYIREIDETELQEIHNINLENQSRDFLINFFSRYFTRHLEKNISFKSSYLY